MAVPKKKTSKAKSRSRKASAWKLHLPSILLLLISGIIAGPVTGFLDPDQLFGDLQSSSKSLLVLNRSSLSVSLGFYEEELLSCRRTAPRDLEAFGSA